MCVCKGAKPRGAAAAPSHVESPNGGVTTEGRCGDRGTGLAIGTTGGEGGDACCVGIAANNDAADAGAPQNNDGAGTANAACNASRGGPTSTLFAAALCAASACGNPFAWTYSSACGAPNLCLIRFVESRTSTITRLKMCSSRCVLNMNVSRVPIVHVATASNAEQLIVALEAQHRCCLSATLLTRVRHDFPSESESTTAVVCREQGLLKRSGSIYHRPGRRRGRN